MKHPPINLNSLPSERERPLWMRSVVVAAIWMMVLQPAVSSAQLVQSPLFTVSSAPPNVMLMFDDSASMNRLELTAPPGFGNPIATGAAPGQAVPKVNTVGYFGIRGVTYYAAGNTFFDGRWEFSRDDVMTRAAAFNPLAYNPAIQYLPWNNNGTRLPVSSIGGTGYTPSGALTEWDPRKLPLSMSMTPTFMPVANYLSAPNHGSIYTGGETRSWSSPRAGSVAYAGLPENILRLSAAAPSGADLFNSTIVFDNPNCGGFTPTTNYSWYCPTAQGPVFGPQPSDTCGAGNVGGTSVNGRCCPAADVIDNPTPGIERRYVYGDFTNPPSGPAPAMTGPGNEVCATIFATGSTPFWYTGAPCTPQAPQDYQCGEDICQYQPPDVCTNYYRNQWGCGYDVPITNHTYTCTNQTPQVCGSSPGPAACTGGAAPLTPTSDARFVSGHFTPARYVIYDGPDVNAPLNDPDRQDLANYRVIMIDRKFGWSGGTRVPTNDVNKYRVVDAVTGQPAPAGSRPDCAAGTWCTWEEEARNYANWFTYYRSRLFAAIGVMSEVASGLVGPEQFMRMGYGRINYLPNARNPWNVSSLGDQLGGSLPTVDGAANVGGVERGVRPFTVLDPPISGVPNVARQQVFDWLFTINGRGPTPNREALHAAGLYFSRSDSQGPWGKVPGAGGGEPENEHLWCRRNYTLLATDGEWTRLNSQPRLEGGGFGSLSPAGSPGSTSVSMSVTGPLINDGTDRDTGVALPPYTFTPGSGEQHITGGFSSSDSRTLTDVLHYYWSHDLRNDLRDSLKTTARDRAFWQHMSAYIVGYGVQASMDDPTAAVPLRSQFDVAGPPRTLIDWPHVAQEDCRQVDDNNEDTIITAGACTHEPASMSTGSGNRINDTLRAALTSGGDFFSATSPTALKASLQAVFAAIGADNSAGTSPALSSSTIGAGNLFIQSGFFTNTWDGYVRAFDQAALVNFLRIGGTQPAPVWEINFAAPTARPIFSSTAMSTAVAFEWGNLSLAQRSDLDPASVSLSASPVLNYLRGDQSKELRFPGGQFRNRATTILGDVVSSTPLYSKGADHGYLRGPAASRVNFGTPGSALYQAYVNAKRTTRTPVAIFGANDGMLHILNASPGSGREIFAYVPRSLYSTLSDLTSSAYAHRFYVDGPVIESDVFDGTAWKTIAIGTTGAGAAGMFAIDITSPQTPFSAANVLWDIMPSDHPDADVASDLGNVLQPGIIGSVKDNVLPNNRGRWVYMVGNGYESVSKQATLFVFDALTGTLLKALKTNVGSAATPNGLGGITPVFDGSRNIIAVYGGDKLGNMWKFDFTSGNINDPDGAGAQKGWEIFNKAGTVPAPLFTATDGGNVRQPITAAPRITPHGISGVHVGFGTGKLFEVGDQLNTQVQTVYVLWDKGQIPTIAKSSLQSIALQDAPWDNDGDSGTPDVADGTFRRLKATDLAAYDWTQEGFYIPLIQEGGTADGERILSPGFLDAGVLSFTSFSQRDGGADRCIPGGSSHVYRFNLVGGLAEAGFLGVSGPVVGRRIQPGLVSAAPPVYEPVAASGPTIDNLSVGDMQTMLQDPKYKQQGARTVLQGPVGTCAHVGLRVDGSMARIPTACAGLLPLRTWRPVR